MPFIFVGLILLSLYYLFAAASALWAACVFAVALLIVSVRAIFNGPRLKRESARRLREENRRERTFANLHLRATMSRTLAEDHPDDWVERFSRWELEENSEG